MHRGAVVKRTSAVVAALGLVLILALLIPLANVLAATYYKTLTTFSRTGGSTTVSVSSASATMTESSSWITVSRSSTYVYSISVSANTGDYRSATVKLVSGSNTTYYTVNQNAGRFLVTFYANGGTGGPGSQYKVYGANITISGTLPTRSGYTFLGWSASSTATSPTYYAGGTYADISSASLYAVWQRNTCLVTLHANGGTLNSYGTSTHSYYVYQYDTTILSETASRTGFTFLGWSTSSTATSPSYAASQYTYVSISSGTTFYAVWQRNTYTLTFNAVGGTCSESSRPVQYAYAFGTLPTPTRSGYTFLGWFTASSGGTKVSSATTMGAGSQTIYAQWSRNTCTVTLNANGSGALLSYYNTSTYSYSVYQYDNTTLTTSASRTGFTFLGWSTSSTATSASYTPNVNIQIPINGNTTFYAVWQRNNYTLTFAAVGGTCSESSRTVAYQAAFGTLPTPTRSGYTFLGWFTASSGGTKVSSATTMGAASQTIYAQWSRNTYTITLSANGTGALLDSFNTSTYSYSIYQNDNITLTSTASRPGYSFLGWSTSSTATSATYTPNPNIQIPITANTTFYAVWQRNNYTLTFNAVGGTCSESSRTVAYQAAFGTLPTPLRSGYTFNGWYTASSGGTKVSSATTMGAASQTIYAQWTRNTCTVTLNANGSGALLDGFNTGTYSYSAYQNDTITLTATASRPGYSFLGWSTTSTATTATYTPNPNIQIPVTANMTFYAVWTCTVRLDANADDALLNYFNTRTHAYSVTPNTMITLTDMASRTGYTFLGWSTSPTATTATYTPNPNIQIPITGNTTFYAVWKRIEYSVTLSANGTGAVLNYYNAATFSYLVLPNSTITITETASRPGYTFLGWATSSAATSATYTPSQYVQIPITANTTFYAVWACTVTLDANGSDAVLDGFNTNTYAYSVTPNSTITLTETASQPGYNFLGWSKTKTATTPTYTPNANIQIPITANTTFFAIWEKIPTCTLTLDANGGTLDDFNTATYSYRVTSDSAIRLTATASREDCPFLGWSESPISPTASYQPSLYNYFQISEDTTFYAVYEHEWEPTSITPTYNVIVLKKDGNQADIMTSVEVCAHCGEERYIINDWVDATNSFSVTTSEELTFRCNSGEISLAPMTKETSEFIKNRTDTSFTLAIPEFYGLSKPEPITFYEARFMCNGISYYFSFDCEDPLQAFLSDLTPATRDAVIDQLILKKDTQVGRTYYKSIAQLNTQLSVDYLNADVMTAFASKTPVFGNHIFINKDGGYDTADTVFHEWAHIIDYNISTYSEGTNLIGEIEADVRNSIKTEVANYYLASGQTYGLADIDTVVDFFMDPDNNEAYPEDRGFLAGFPLTASQADCVTYVQNAYNNSLSGISRDVYGGVTNNFIGGGHGMWSVPVWDHYFWSGESYRELPTSWKTMVELEFFAHAMETYMMGAGTSTMRANFNRAISKFDGLTIFNYGGLPMG